MDPCRRQADEDVAGLDVFAGNDLVAVDDADAEASQVIVVFGIEAGHFSRFAAEESAARFLAGMGDTFDNGRNLDRVELADGDVVQEEERFGALDENVIDGHGDAVLTDCIVFAHHDGQAEFRADAVGTADQDRFLDVAVHQGKEAAKAAKVTEDFRTVRGFDRIFHQFYGFVASIDVDAGISISQSFICVREHIFLLPHWPAECP